MVAALYHSSHFISALFIMHSKVYKHVSLFNMLSAEHVYLINLCHGAYEA